MKLGPLVRRMFGPFERQISDIYRSIYVDIEAFVGQVHQWQPSATKILEVGCGEGAVTRRLRATFPRASITAIDITHRVGRLYAGPFASVRFIQCGVEQIAAAESGQYDLVVLCDVLHHVPLELRQSLLDAVRAVLAPQGSFVFKDWQRNQTPIHWLCYVSDRWITGDRVRYMTRTEMRANLEHSFGAAGLVAEARIGPWWNNIATLVRI